MGPLEAAIDEASSDDLEAAIRLVHVAGQAQRRLLGAWATRARITEEPYPPLLAALCLEIGLELEFRSGRPRLCPSCLRTVGRVRWDDGATDSTRAATVASEAGVPAGPGGTP